MFAGRRGRWLSLFLLLIPVEVHVPGDSSGTGDDDGRDSGTRLTVDFLGGGGTYAIVPRDCDGNQTGAARGVPYREGTGGVELSKDWWDVGVRGGWLRSDQPEYTFSVPPGGTFPTPSVARSRHELRYVNPYAAFHWNWIGMGGGPLWASEETPGQKMEASGHLRIGRRRGCFEYSVMEGMPLLSGGGYVRLGARVAFREHDSMFFGISAGDMPFDQAGFVVNADVAVTKRYSLLARARLGSAAGRSESGGALGLRWSQEF